MTAPWLEDPALVEPAPGFAGIGLVAFTTTRHAGTFGLHAQEASHAVWGRWLHLAQSVEQHTNRLVFAHQVHGATVVDHGTGWRGILRVPDADGHLASTVGTAMAVTLADCIPVFIGHPSGAGAILHSGWKGTVAGITRVAIERLRQAGLDPADLVVHCGPGICGSCYEVSPDVFARLTGRVVDHPTPVDLRERIMSDAVASGVQDVTSSALCTRCHNGRFFSHRGGDAGRQVGVLVTRGAAGA